MSLFPLCEFWRNKATTAETKLKVSLKENTELKERLAKFSKLVEQELSEDQLNKVKRRMSA